MKKILKFSLVPLTIFGAATIAISCGDGNKDYDNEKAKKAWLENSEKGQLVKKQKVYFNDATKFANLKNELLTLMTSEVDQKPFLEKAYETEKDFFKNFEKFVTEKLSNYPEEKKGMLVVINYVTFMSVQIAAAEEKRDELNALFDKYFTLENNEMRFKIDVNGNYPELDSDLAKLETYAQALEKYVTLINQHSDKLKEISKSLNTQAATTTSSTSAS
ncbi:hypothetical protein [Mesomycoplasma lagogenitalium]|uniref:Lipoprotein n=1 Tax=Mesomycoplasma lagogenitalium TaxID=171286 RepID=A0ABY8LUD2_9BACT|nr:hypothetical protein [Mesomycoplasma lagogenitalium]WGI36845.1 hypothetical protein QEG99_01000 [Mesomycoplasma lagogenitalium]